MKHKSKPLKNSKNSKPLQKIKLGWRSRHWIRQRRWTHVWWILVIPQEAWDKSWDHSHILRVAEIPNRTLNEAARSMKLAWKIHLGRSNFYSKRMITTALKTGHIPYQLWFGKKSNLKHVQLLGVCPYPRQKQDIKSSFIIETTMPRIMCAIFCVGVAFSEEVVLFGEWAGSPPYKHGNFVGQSVWFLHLPIMSEFVLIVCRLIKTVLSVTWFSAEHVSVRFIVVSN